MHPLTRDAMHRPDMVVVGRSEQHRVFTSLRLVADGRIAVRADPSTQFDKQSREKTLTCYHDELGHDILYIRAHAGDR